MSHAECIHIIKLTCWVYCCLKFDYANILSPEDCMTSSWEDVVCHFSWWCNWTVNISVTVMMINHVEGVTKPSSSLFHHTTFTRLLSFSAFQVCKNSFIYLTIISPSNGSYTMLKPPYLSIWLHYVDHSCCLFVFLYTLYLNSFILRLISS